MTQTGRVSRFRGDIEGLRGVAVLLVVFGHVTGWPRGGFIGVDVFFVISGFLITGLLVAERERTGRISIRGFYARRVRRLLPAGVLVLVLTDLAASIVLLPGLGLLAVSGGDDGVARFFEGVFRERTDIGVAVYDEDDGRSAVVGVRERLFDGLVHTVAQKGYVDARVSDVRTATTRDPSAGCPAACCISGSLRISSARVAVKCSRAAVAARLDTGGRKRSRALRPRSVQRSNRFVG